MKKKEEKHKVKSSTVRYECGTAEIYLVIPHGFVPPPTITLYQRPNEYVYTYVGSQN